ncbi:MAG TPA: 50S ribosomal protein L17 [Planctomycetota bacterium]|nr:50S ribosomal protein L17 [Planctomycetota bacterium]
MRHRIHGRKLNRSGAHRLALQRNLTRSLFAAFGDREYIITTKEKAKFVRPFAEKLITLGKAKSLHNYRRGIQILRDEDMVKKLFDVIGPRYQERPGGYLRILRTSKRRLGDKASQVLLGFVGPVGGEPAAAPPPADTARAGASKASASRKQGARAAP